MAPGLKAWFSTVPMVCRSRESTLPYMTPVLSRPRWRMIEGLPLSGPLLVSNVTAMPGKC